MDKSQSQNVDGDNLVYFSLVQPVRFKNLGTPMFSQIFKGMQREDARVIGVLA